MILKVFIYIHSIEFRKYKTVKKKTKHVIDFYDNYEYRYERITI